MEMTAGFEVFAQQAQFDEIGRVMIRFL